MNLNTMYRLILQILFATNPFNLMSDYSSITTGSTSFYPDVIGLYILPFSFQILLRYSVLLHFVWVLSICWLSSSHF